MRGNYKVLVRVPIYATAEIEYTAYGVESYAAAIAEAQDSINSGDVAMWFKAEWNPHTPIPSLAEVIKFEATETDTTKEGTNEQDH